MEIQSSTSRGLQGSPVQKVLIHLVSLPLSQNSVNPHCSQDFSLFCEARSHAKDLGESRLFAKKHEFENLGPLRATRLPAMKQRSEWSSERCGTNSGRVGKLETPTCFRANGNLLAKKPQSTGSPMSCTAHLESQLQFSFYIFKTKLFQLFQTNTVAFFSPLSLRTFAFPGNSENQFPVSDRVHSCFWEMAFLEFQYRKLIFQSVPLVMSNFKIQETPLQLTCTINKHIAHSAQNCLTDPAA